MFGGFAGSFFATRQGFISPESFTFIESAIILAIVVLGGMGSQIGVVLAAIVLIGCPELVRELAEFRMLAFGGRWCDHDLAAARAAGHREPTIRLASFVKTQRDGRRQAGCGAMSGGANGGEAAPLLDVEHLTMRFGGLVAVDDLSFVADAERDHRDHRPERRRQDHRLQLPDRLLQADASAG